MGHIIHARSTVICAAHARHHIALWSTARPIIRKFWAYFYAQLRANLSLCWKPVSALFSLFLYFFLSEGWVGSLKERNREENRILVDWVIIYHFYHLGQLSGSWKMYCSVLLLFLLVIISFIVQYNPSSKNC